MNRDNRMIAAVTRERNLFGYLSGVQGIKIPVSFARGGGGEGRLDNKIYYSRALGHNFELSSTWRIMINYMSISEYAMTLIVVLKSHDRHSIISDNHNTIDHKTYGCQAYGH